MKSYPFSKLNKFGCYKQDNDDVINSLIMTSSSGQLLRDQYVNYDIINGPIMTS